MTRLEELLRSCPRDQWTVEQVYSYGWYDGPTEGACSLSTPACEFYFELLDERYNPDGLDDRLYRLSELPPGSVAEFLTIHQNGDLASADLTVRSDAVRRLEAVRARRRPTPVVVHTQDMEHFLGCWNIDPATQDVKDWFAYLNIPPVEPSSVE